MAILRKIAAAVRAWLNAFEGCACRDAYDPKSAAIEEQKGKTP